MARRLGDRRGRRAALADGNAQHRLEQADTPQRHQPVDAGRVDAETGRVREQWIELAEPHEGVRSTHSSSFMMRPDFSATWMKSEGGTSPTN